MPIYEYQCDACGHKLEKLQKISDDRLRDCPACDQPKLTKLVSAAAFRLKGAGWYETDFKTGKKKNVTDASDSSTKSSSDSSSDSSTKSSSDSTSSKSDSSNKGDSSSSSAANT